MGFGSYYETSGQLGRIDPGIDVSHYGAPYQGMLGLGAFYANAGLGWAPGPGQTPADDPRMVRQFGKVRQTYRVRSVPSDKAADAAAAILRAARTTFAGSNVSKASGAGFSNGWGPGGRVGVDITVPVATRLGELKAKGKGIQNRNVISEVSPGATLIDASTGVAGRDIVAAPDAPAPAPDAPVDPGGAPVPPPEGFLTQRVAGVPMWAIGSLSLVAVGGIIFAVTRKKKAVAANRRRRRRSRR